VGSVVTDLLQIKFNIYSRDTRKSGTVHQLFIEFKKAYDSVKREVLYSILL
jgi:hypothetical protein